jgi:hypothetical protein
MSLRSITATANQIMGTLNQVRRDSGENALVEGSREWTDTWSAIYCEVEIGFESLKEEMASAIKHL